MKKCFFIIATACVVMGMTSCKSSESAYKKAYEKAQATATTTVVEQPVQQTTPVAVTPVTPQQTTDYSNVAVRTENVSLVSGSSLKPYGVVIGSFGVQSNAVALCSKMQGQGYNSAVVKAVVNGQDFYRVVAASFDTKNEAAALRAKLIGTYEGTWLLYSK